MTVSKYAISTKFCKQTCYKMEEISDIYECERMQGPM